MQSVSPSARGNTQKYHLDRETAPQLNKDSTAFFMSNCSSCSWAEQNKVIAHAGAELIKQCHEETTVEMEFNIQRHGTHV